MRIGRHNIPYDAFDDVPLPYGDKDDGFRMLAKPHNSTLQWGYRMRDKTLPLSDFFDIEHGNESRHGLEDLKKSILKDGIKSGPGQRVFVVVDAKGKPKLKEGNHRIWALKELYKEKEIDRHFRVPTMVSYLGNSDLRKRSWIPKSKR